MEEAQLAELGRLFDEYLFGNRKLPATQQAILIYKAIARDVYAAQTDAIKTKYTLDRFIAEIVNVDVLDYLKKRQTAHPTITPERLPPK